MITSLQNERIKGLVRLQESRERRKRGCFLIEGAREIQRAVSYGYKIQEAYFCEDVLSEEARNILPQLSKVEEVSEAVFKKVSYRESKDGLIVVAENKELDLEGLGLREDSCVLVLESVEKPGNLGAILRTADGCGMDAVIVCDRRVDVYNPNVIRASLGCLFTGKVAVSSIAETYEYLHQKGLRIIATDLTANYWYDEEDYKGGCALVLGTEADGLSEAALSGADSRIKIPMRGDVDSLNVSVAAGIVSYEAMRQRGVWKA